MMLPSGTHIPLDRLPAYREIAATFDAVRDPALAAALHYLHIEILKLRHPELNPPSHLHADHPDRFDANRRED